MIGTLALASASCSANGGVTTTTSSVPAPNPASSLPTTTAASTTTTPPTTAAPVGAPTASGLLALLGSVLCHGLPACPLSKVEVSRVDPTWIYATLNAGAVPADYVVRLGINGPSVVWSSSSATSAACAGIPATILQSLLLSTACSRSAG